MEITLPADVLEELPSPDDQGLVRVSIAMKVGEEGSAEIVEINDVPVAREGTEEDASMPSPDDIAASVIA